MLFDEPIPFIVALLLVLLLAKVLGELFERFGIPSIIGEVLAGVILGPSVIGLVSMTEEVRVISELGVFLLIILAGMEIDIEQLFESMHGRNVWISIFAFFIPFLSGIGLGLLMDLGYTLSLVLGLCISITALPVSVRILMDMKILNTNVGQRIISAAVFNDVFSLLILGVLLDVTSHTQNNWSELSISIIFTIIKVLAFMVVIIFAYRLIKAAGEKVVSISKRIDTFLVYLHGKESLFALVIVFILLFASLSQLVGLSFIIGTFFGAMLLPREMLGKTNFMKVHDSTSTITIGFLSPIFFATMGIQFELDSLQNWSFVLLVIAISFASKILAGYIGGRLAGFKSSISYYIGAGLNARGLMELVIANIALQNGFIDITMFSILVLMGLLTTLVTPFMLKSYAAEFIKQQNNL